MTSSEFGLDIKKTLLSKTTLGKVSGVDKSLQKAAKNYLLLGKISHNLNLINKNIINLVRAFGIEAREKEDTHYLKQNERESRFRFESEKYINSKVKKVDPDGDSLGGSGILGWFARKRIKKAVTKLATRVLLRLRKNQFFKSLVKLINKFKRQIKNFFKQLDFKKIIVNWWKEKGEPFIKELFNKAGKLFEKLGPLFKRAFPKLTARLASILASSAVTGPLAPFVAIGLVAGFVIYDGIMGAIEEVAAGGNGFVGFFSGIIEGITFGIFDRKLIADKMYQVGDFFKKIYTKIKELVKTTVDFISEKFDNYVKPFFEDAKKKFDISSKEKEYSKEVEEYQRNFEKQQKILEDNLKKETEYITGLANENRKKFEVKRRLIKDIEALEKEERDLSTLQSIAQEGYGYDQSATDMQGTVPSQAPRPAPARPAPAPAQAPRPAQAPPATPRPAPAVQAPPTTPSPVPATSATAKPGEKYYSIGDGKFISFSDLSKIISKHEGNKDSVYGDIWKTVPDPNDPSGKKKMRIKANVYGPIPEEWSITNLGSSKPLSEFTFTELLKYMLSRPTSTGAGGIAGFMPSTIFGPKLDGSHGLFKQALMAWTDKFSEDNQKKLQMVMSEEQDKVLLNGLKKLGIKAITPGMKLAANYVGASGLLWVIEEGMKDAEITAREALIKRHPKNLDPTKGPNGSVINRDLATTKAKDFVAVKESFIMGQVSKMNIATVSNPQNVGGPDTSSLSNAFVATEPTTGKSIIYDSKEMFLGHREQKKPTDVDVVNILQTENTKLIKQTTKSEPQKIDSANILLSRVA